MSPLLLLLGVVLAFRLAGYADFAAFDSWSVSVPFALGTTFILMGAGHFTVLKGDLLRMVPAGLPAPRLLVGLVGLVQVIGGAGMLFGGSRFAAAYVLVVLLILKLPANIKAARSSLQLRGRWATPHLLRVPSQAVWISLLLWSAHGL